MILFLHSKQNLKSYDVVIAMITLIIVKQPMREI
mgnify:FL=1